jgi:hypothetical protein
MRRLLLALSALFFAACMPPRVTVTPAGSGLELPPREADCQVEFFRTKPPDRPYDEIGALHVRAYQDDAGAAQEAMREQACALGADAVVVTRDYALGLMTATAVSYRDLRQQRRIDAALKRAEAERAAAAQAAAREAEAKARAAKAGAAKASAAKASAASEAVRAAAPAGFVQARVKRLATTHELADRRGKEVADLSAGTPVWVAPKASSGWRRIWTPGGQAAWIEDDALEVRAAPPPAPQPADPGARAGGSHTDV